jgi:hypothetical protein
MAGISAFDIIGELKYLEEKGVIAPDERKIWESKAVREGVTDEIIEQMAVFKRREIEIRKGDEATRKTQPEAPSGPSSRPTVSEIIMELRQLAAKGVIDSSLCREWESKIIKGGINEDVIERINLLKTNKGIPLSEAAPTESVKSSTSENPADESKAANTSVFGIAALALGAVGLLVPYFAAIFLVPVALVLSCISVYKKEKLGKAAVVVAAIGLIWIFYVSFQIHSIMENPFASNSSSSSSFSSSSESRLVTMSKYNRLRDGMSYEDVARAVGSRGSEISRTSSGGYTIVMYGWENNNGSNMIAMFENGRLTTKSQFGLR